MTKEWTYRTTQDRLLVFVSSRLQECSKERSVISRAVKSLRHEPVLFEHLGAKPYPPRDLYLSRLRDSQIMVGVYSLGYGYVDAANGMTISGLEDEFRFAQKNGIPSLLYVSRFKDGREPRLQELIDEFTSGPYTVHFYDDPEELGNRVGSDLTALISDTFLQAAAQRAIFLETAADILERAARAGGVLVPRVKLITNVIEASRAAPVLCVHGAAGIGKTTLAAQFSVTTAALFVRASGLAPKDLFSACVHAITRSSPGDASSFATLDAARRALVEAWRSEARIVLVLDESEFVPEVIAALEDGGGTSEQKRVVFTSRVADPRYVSFEVPSLTQDEVDAIVRETGSPDRIPASAIASGNPLALQQAAAEAALGANSTGLAQLRGAAGEVVRYLGLAGDIPLSAEQVLKLRGDPSYTIEALYADIARLGRLVDDSPRGLRLMHSETAMAVVDEVRRSPQRLRFYAGRLVRMFEEAGEARRAYAVAALFGDGTEKRYAVAAAREAARVGDWKLGVTLVEQLLAQALSEESRADALHQMVSLIAPLELMGEANRAAKFIQDARALAARIGPAAVEIVREAEVGSRARRDLRIEDVAELRAIYDSYSAAARSWDQARVGLDLAALYIAARRYEDARDVLGPTLATFQELGDEYGTDLAERNLASALSGIPGAEAEAELAIQKIKRRETPEGDTRRHRAWLCNILTRRYRQAGRYEDADSVAREAIQLGAELGDEYVRGINLINLGNVFRDKHQPVLAIEAYDAAAVAAQKCARRDIEADASRLIAGVLNDFEDVQGVAHQRVLARTHALHAVGLLRGGVNVDSLASALVELSDAQESLGEIREAAEAMFEASQAFRDARDAEGHARALMRASHLSLPAHRESYLAQMAAAMGASPPAEDSPLIDRFVALVKPIVERAPRRAAIRLLTLHLRQTWALLPEEMRGALVALLTKMLAESGCEPAVHAEPWRVLYAAVVMSHLLGSRREAFFLNRLARVAATSVPGLYSREEPGGTRCWNVVLNLKRRVTVTVAAQPGWWALAQAG